MSRVPAKKIERLLKKEGIEVNGYEVLEELSDKAIDVANNEGMENGITEPYEFVETLEYGEVSLKFYCGMNEGTRNTGYEEIPYYYLQVDSCEINSSTKQGKVIDISVFDK